MNALIILTFIMTMFSFQAVATKSNPNDIRNGKMRISLKVLISWNLQ